VTQSAAQLLAQPVSDTFDLSGQSEAIARTFDGIGENLAACHGGIGQVVAEAAHIAGELHNDALESAIASIDPILDHCRDLLVDFGEEGALLSALGQTILATRNPVTSLASTIRMVHMVSVNARIVSAGIETSEDLGVFTFDLGELIAEMNRVVGRFVALNGALAKKVQVQAAQHRQFMHDQGAGLERTIASLPAELAKLAKMGEGADRLQRSLAENAAILQQSLSRAVPLLQVGDATRQRLEHITNLPASLPAGHPANGGAIIAQLRGELLDGAIAQIESDIAFAGSELKQIAQSVSRIVEQASGGRSDDSRKEVARLNSAIEDTLGLLGDCERGREQSSFLRDDTRGSLDELGACMVELDDIVHAAGLVSLNAAISCVRLGDQGAPLAVVAEQVRELNRDINGLSALIVEVITQAQAQFNLFSNCRSDGTAAFAGFRDHFSCALGQLDEANDRIDGLQGSLTAAATEIDKRLQAMQQHTHCIDGILHELTARADLPRLAVPQGETLANADFEPARSLLTMQAERDIFDAVLQSARSEGAIRRVG